jgi:hypothetical protein
VDKIFPVYQYKLGEANQYKTSTVFFDISPEDSPIYIKDGTVSNVKI